MNSNISKETKKLILWKIEVEVPPHHKLSIGNKGVFTKEQLKQHVEKGDELGEMYINMQLNFLRALAKGDVF